jgi:ABC-2 type transport system ATP-binding protein
MIEAGDVGEVARHLPRLAMERGVTISRIEPADESLESVFRYLVEGR